MLILFTFLLLLSLVNLQGFEESDLEVLQDNVIMDELDKTTSDSGPWYFKVDGRVLDVQPSTVQNDASSVTFTF